MVSDLKNQNDNGKDSPKTLAELHLQYSNDPEPKFLKMALTKGKELEALKEEMAKKPVSTLTSEAIKKMQNTNGVER